MDTNAQFGAYTGRAKHTKSFSSSFADALKSMNNDVKSRASDDTRDSDSDDLVDYRMAETKSKVNQPKITEEDLNHVTEMVLEYC